jgi:RNase P protein component
VKSVNRERAHRVIRAALEKIEHENPRGDLKFDVDVDPVEMQ